MILAISDAGWGAIGLLTTNVVAFAALFVRQGRTRTEVSQINRAVNHQPDDAPTLVQRVEQLEVGAWDAAVHRGWEREVLQSLAAEVGAKLPPHPQGDT